MTAVSVQVGSGVKDQSLPRAGLGADRQLIMPGQEARQRVQAGAGDFLIPVGTHWVERDVLRVSEEVSRRWPNLAVVSCQCGRCGELGHYPHMVVEQLPTGESTPVLGFMQFSREVIEQLSMAEQAESADLLERMRKEKEATLRERQRKATEARDEAKAVLVSALRSNKQHWVGPNGVATDPTGRAFASKRRTQRVKGRR